MSSRIIWARTNLKFPPQDRGGLYDRFDFPGQAVEAGGQNRTGTSTGKISVSMSSEGAGAAFGQDEEVVFLQVKQNLFGKEDPPGAGVQEIDQVGRGRLTEGFFDQLAQPWRRQRGEGNRLGERRMERIFSYASGDHKRNGKGFYISGQVFKK